VKNLLSEQSGDIRFEWGEVGAGHLGGSARVLILVDIFSFSTALDVAASRRAQVYPVTHGDRAAAEFARAHGAFLGVDRRKLSKESPYSLWPTSLTTLPAAARLVLPTLHGTTLTLGAARNGGHIFAGCFRNSTAIANAAARLGAPIAVIAAGERWPTEAYRPALEDLLGAGSIISTLIAAGLRPSPEASAAAAAFHDAAGTLLERLRSTLSARELAAIGSSDDAAFASQIDVSTSLPYFKSAFYADYTHPR
jgi:2-phosphosulfolactate phosphatase